MPFKRMRHREALSRLVPLHGIAVPTALVIFQSVSKGGGVTSERKVIARVGRKHHRTTHVEAMEVALERSRCH